MMTKIIVDSREDAWVQEIFGGGDPAALPCGDFFIIRDDSSIALVERKEISDLVGSACGRLMEQICKMQVVSSYGIEVFLLVCVDPRRGIVPDKNGGVYLYGHNCGFGYSALWGVIETIQRAGLIYRECVNSSESIRDAITAISAVHDREKTVIKTRVKAANPQLQFMTNLPWVGEKSATDLLTDRTPAQAIEYLTGTDYDKKYRKIADSLRVSLGLADGQFLKIVVKQTSQSEF